LARHTLVGCRLRQLSTNTHTQNKTFPSTWQDTPNTFPLYTFDISEKKEVILKLSIDLLIKIKNEKKKKEQNTCIQRL
jgi:hypothetical protein